MFFSSPISSAVPVRVDEQIPPEPPQAQQQERTRSSKTAIKLKRASSLNCTCQWILADTEKGKKVPCKRCKTSHKSCCGGRPCCYCKRNSWRETECGLDLIGELKQCRTAEFLPTNNFPPVLAIAEPDSGNTLPEPKVGIQRCTTFPWDGRNPAVLPYRIHPRVAPLRPTFSWTGETLRTTTTSKDQQKAMTVGCSAISLLPTLEPAVSLPQVSSSELLCATRHRSEKSQDVATGHPTPHADPDACQATNATSADIDVCTADEGDPQVNPCVESRIERDVSSSCEGGYDDQLLLVATQTPLLHSETVGYCNDAGHLLDTDLQCQLERLPLSCLVADLLFDQGIYAYSTLPPQEQPEQ